MRRIETLKQLRLRKNEKNEYSGEMFYKLTNIDQCFNIIRGLLDGKRQEQGRNGLHEPRSGRHRGTNIRKSEQSLPLEMELKIRKISRFNWSYLSWIAKCKAEASRINHVNRLDDQGRGQGRKTTVI